MITYNRSAFGLNLIVQIHGSAVYRAIFPSLMSVVIFFLWRTLYRPHASFGEELGHPYAIGALVASASFLMVFRANQGYARYWEGCSSVHHMMSKWMDSTIHAGVYHLQCDHYKDIKPPSYFDYPELNHLYLTRDRERAHGMEDDDEHHQQHSSERNDKNQHSKAEDDDDVDLSQLKDPTMNRRKHHSEGVINTTATATTTAKSNTTFASSSRQQEQLRAQLQRRSLKNRRHVIQEERMKRQVQAVSKSINYVTYPASTKRRHKKEHLKQQASQRLQPQQQQLSSTTKWAQDLPTNDTKKNSINNKSKNTMSFRRSQSANDISHLMAAGSLGDSEVFDLLQQQVAEATTMREPTQPGIGKPFPLWGKPRLDGNLGALFHHDDKGNVYSSSSLPSSTATSPPPPSLATFASTKERYGSLPKEGFASMQGGRTPPLFLQELAHLSSLMTAVALSTLRNDIDGAESPLAYYDPGSEWPTVDPDRDDWMKLTVSSGVGHVQRNFLTFLGMGRSPEEQTRYNAGRPLPVIGGISDAEIRFLQMAKGPYAKTQLCWNWISEFMMREHLAGSMGNVGPPIVSRCIQFLGDGMIYYNHARKIMFVPFPFVHAQLSVLFILVIIPTIPFLMDQYTDEAWLGSVLTFFTVLCLAGINEVARELENPFRNVPNELPLVTFMAQYNEALFTMYSGYHPDHYWNGQDLLRKRAEMSSGMNTAATANTDDTNGESNVEVGESSLAEGNGNENENENGNGEGATTSTTNNGVDSQRRGATSSPSSSSSSIHPLNDIMDEGNEDRSNNGNGGTPNYAHDNRNHKNDDEILQLKEQVAKQAILIEQLFAQLGPVDPTKATQQLEEEATMHG